MAANRFDPAKAEVDTGAETAPAAAASPSARSAGGWQAWLPLIVAVVLMPAMAWGVTQWVLVPQIQKGLGLPTGGHLAAPNSAAGHGGAAAGEKPAGKAGAATARETVPMTKLLVNVSGTMGSRYLLTSVTLVGSGPDFKSRIDQADAQLRDVACGILSTKTITELEKPGARNLVRSELIAGFNNILGGGMVQEIYITEFAIQ